MRHDAGRYRLDGIRRAPPQDRLEIVFSPALMPGNFAKQKRIQSRMLLMIILGHLKG
jgi:hypothetical protein